MNRRIRISGAIMKKNISPDESEYRYIHGDNDIEMILPEDAPPLTAEWIDERLKELVVEYLKSDTPKSAPQR